MTTDRSASRNATVVRAIVWASLLVIVALGAHLRLNTVLHSEIDNPVRNDAKQYFVYAYNLAQHGIYSQQQTGPSQAPQPDALRPPVYSLFLSLFLKPDMAIEDFVVNVTVVQALLSTVTIVLSYLLALRLVGALGALLVAALVALSPHIVNMNIYLLTETLFTLLLLCFCLTVLSTGKYRMLLLVVSGALLAATALTRNWIQYFSVVVVVWIIFSELYKGRHRNAVVFFLSFVCCFAIWPLRNYLALGASSDNTLMINGLHHGMYPNFMYMGRAETFGFPYRFDPRSLEISQSVSTILAEILGRFRSDFIEHLRWFTWGKATTLLSWSTIQGVNEFFIYPPARTPYFDNDLLYWSYRASRILHLPLMCLAVAGMALAWLPRALSAGQANSVAAARLLSLLMLYFVAVHLVTAPFPRYAITMKPILFLLAIYSLKIVVDVIRQRSTAVR